MKTKKELESERDGRKLICKTLKSQIEQQTKSLEAMKADLQHFQSQCSHDREKLRRVKISGSLPDRYVWICPDCFREKETDCMRTKTFRVSLPPTISELSKHRPD